MTVRNMSRLLGILIGIASLVVLASPLRGALPKDIFPEGTIEPTDDAGWSELAARFPHLLKRVESAGASSPTSPPPTRISLREHMDYLRIRRVASDLIVLENALETQMLVLDLRYVWADLPDAVKLGALLARSTLNIQTVSPTDAATTTIEPAQKRAPKQAVVVLVNHGTSGALEVVLDALQAAGDILLVGARTAGDTGVFSDQAVAEGWRSIGGQMQRAGGPNLLGVGVEPRLTIATDEASDETAYLALDSGTPIVTLLDAPVEKARFDEAKLLRAHGEANGRTPSRLAAAEETASPASAGTSPQSPATAAPAGQSSAASAANPSATQPAPARPPFDRTLERAVNTLLALEALQRI